MEAHILGVVISGLIVLLTIFAIYVFIVYGGHSLFYAITAIDLACAFINAWLMSRGFYDAKQAQGIATPQHARSRKGRAQGNGK